MTVIIILFQTTLVLLLLLLLLLSVVHLPPVFGGYNTNITSFVVIKQQQQQHQQQQQQQQRRNSTTTTRRSSITREIHDVVVIQKTATTTTATTIMRQQQPPNIPKNYYHRQNVYRYQSTVQKQKPNPIIRNNNNNNNSNTIIQQQLIPIQQSRNLTQIQIQPIELQESRDLTQRIVGGTIVSTVWEYPSFVSTRGCGGTLIRANLVLTAAHCEETYRRYPYIYIGSITRLQGNKYNIQSYHIHPGYNKQRNTHDIMIVQLSCPVRSTNIPYQKLNYNHQIPYDNNAVTVIGYGATSERTSQVQSQQLRQVTVHVINGTQCRYNYQGWIVDRIMICAGILYYGGKDACIGDSGGPLVMKRTTKNPKTQKTITTVLQVGIVSFGDGCAEPMYPGVYTRISPYRKWITKIIQQYSINRTSIVKGC